MRGKKTKPTYTTRPARVLLTLAEMERAQRTFAEAVPHVDGAIRIAAAKLQPLAVKRQALRGALARVDRALRPLRGAAKRKGRRYSSR